MTTYFAPTPEATPVPLVGRPASTVHGDPHGVWEDTTLHAVGCAWEGIADEFGCPPWSIERGLGDGRVVLVFGDGGEYDAYRVYARMSDHHADARLVLRAEERRVTATGLPPVVVEADDPAVGLLIVSPERGAAWPPGRYTDRFPIARLEWLTDGDEPPRVRVWLDEAGFGEWVDGAPL